MLLPMENREAGTLVEAGKENFLKWFYSKMLISAIITHGTTYFGINTVQAELASSSQYYDQKTLYQLKP